MTEHVQVPENRPIASRLNRHDAVVLTLLTMTALLVAVRIVWLPSIAGIYVDDGIYLATGKALADGQGYRHIELPGEPYQTKYPDPLSARPGARLAGVSEPS